jgi:hypothetical protein
MIIGTLKDEKDSVCRVSLIFSAAGIDKLRRKRSNLPKRIPQRLTPPTEIFDTQIPADRQCVEEVVA